MNYYQSFSIIECSAPKGHLNLHTKDILWSPQSSLLSPLLFLIYINDITQASSLLTTLFADDINLHTSNSCFNVLQTTASPELCKIDQWLRANKFSLNYNETNFMSLNSQKHNPTSFKVIVKIITYPPKIT